MHPGSAANTAGGLSITLYPSDRSQVMNTTIVAQATESTPHQPCPVIRVHRINAFTFMDGLRLCMATGVIEVDGAAYLGEIRVPSDAPTEFTVAALITRQNQMISA